VIAQPFGSNTLSIGTLEHTVAAGVIGAESRTLVRPVPAVVVQVAHDIHAAQTSTIATYELFRSAVVVDGNTHRTAIAYFCCCRIETRTNCSTAVRKWMTHLRAAAIVLITEI